MSSERVVEVVILVSFFAACAERVGGPTFELNVSPLSLPGVDFACYDVAITTPDGPVVRLGDPALAYVDGDTRALCSSRFGSGAGGDISYVAPCDAEATNTVTVWFDGLYAGTPDITDIGGWRDPCPDGCSMVAECHENRDTAVTFNFTVMRDARQGFFDIAVNFEDIFCSAKLDCVDAFLHDPTTGDRGPTAVLGFACTSGQSPAGTPQETHIYLADLRIECTNPERTYHFDASAGPGQVGGQPPGVFEAAFYRGKESLAGIEKCYWNAAIGMDLKGDCWLRARGTASDHPLAGGNTPANTMYPIIEWDVQLTAAGDTVCDVHPLNGGNGVATAYTDFSSAHFECGMACGSGAIACDGRTTCAGTTPALGPVTLSQAPGLVTILFEGQRHDFPIDPTYTVDGCCADACCTTEGAP